MNPREAGFLLLTSQLGDPNRRPLSPAQMRQLGQRVRQMEHPAQERELDGADLTALGYSREMAERIVCLLDQEELLHYYVRRGRERDCVPIPLISQHYPRRLRDALSYAAPGCLWAKGDLQILDTPMISLVGSRELNPENECFARRVGTEAARQGYTLVSGNARGADKVAQNACLSAGGRVISIVADELKNHKSGSRVLYLSELSYDDVFSAPRALSRNRCIHALGEKVFAAQCSNGTGGTWDGTVKNLRFGWSPVFVFRDGSEAMELLCQMGAEGISEKDLGDFSALFPASQSFLTE